MDDKTLMLLGGAHVHLPDHLSRIERRAFRIAHVHDHDRHRMHDLCEKTGARPLEHLDNLHELAVAGAIVCSETAHHEAHVSAALEAGTPVFTEKPVAGSGAAARRLADIAEDRGVALMTGYFMRTNRGLRCLKSAIDSGAIGTVTQARMRFAHDGGFADWLDLDTWMTVPELACYGGFADEVVHVLDTLAWLIAPIEHAHAVTGHALGYPVDDHGAAVLRFENGAVGVAEAGWTDNTMRLEISIEGTDGAAIVADQRLEIFPRGEDMPSTTAMLDPLDAGAGVEPFLDLLEGKKNEAAVPAASAVHVNGLLDRMGLRLV